MSWFKERFKQYENDPPFWSGVLRLTLIEKLLEKGLPNMERELPERVTLADLVRLAKKFKLHTITISFYPFDIKVE